MRSEIMTMRPRRKCHPMTMYLAPAYSTWRM